MGLWAMGYGLWAMGLLRARRISALGTDAGLGHRHGPIAHGP